MDTPYRALLLASLAGVLAACPEEASVGKDKCLGASTSCVPPEAKELAPNESLEVRTNALTVLGPVWSRPIALPAAAGAKYLYSQELGQLVGGGPMSLWVMSPGADGKSLAAFTLDLEGEITGETVVAAEEPKHDSDDENKPYAGPKGAVTFHGVWPDNQVSPGPILRASWTHACSVVSDDFSDRCGHDELLVFGADTGAPIRRFSKWGVSMLHAPDGGLWTFGFGPLRKYDTTGETTVEQTLLARSVRENQTVLHTDAVQPGVTFESGELGIASFQESGSPPDVYLPELWRFDEDGNVIYHAYLRRGAVNMTSITDSQGGWTLVSSSAHGDLEFGRVDWVNNKFSDYQRVTRESYAELWIRSATRDSADNIYVLTQTGMRNEETPTLCRLPPEGAVTCYLVPELTSSNIVGGDAGSFYAAVSALDTQAKVVAETGVREAIPAELFLQRYEWPEP